MKVSREEYVNQVRVKLQTKKEDLISFLKITKISKVNLYTKTKT